MVESFPSGGLLPKEETAVASFLATHPEYDGREVLVAIFDTGCDPAAAGLARTPTGEAKFIDFIDATGSGDVDTSTVVEAAPVEGVARFVSPLTGRDLLVPVPALAITNPRAKWHVGVKRAYELFPAPLVDRMKKERRKIFDEAQRRLELDLAQRLANWDERAAAAAAAATSGSNPSTDESDAPSTYPATYTPKDKADLEARLAEVKTLASKYEDIGPVYDVLAWHEGAAGDDLSKGCWRAMVDSTGTGDFTHAKPMTNYREERQYATFSGIDLMNYTISIYQQGRVVSLVTAAGSHGTHVAGIVGAYEGPNSPHNGIAPGCRMVSIKIGDSRLGSMETGVGLVRGLIEAIRLKVDVINMSYGESSSMPNSGRISELIRSAIFDHGIVFVSSAGNNGPALSTAGTPGGTDTGVISVAAFVSPAMSLACYSSRVATPENAYSWSSRGPTIDGAPGVTIAACGGAITSVCQWSLQKVQLMNGTSMSSPAAAGGIALLLSGLKALNIPYTPQRIKHAIENTARTVPHLDPLTLGCGLLQVQAAFDFLVHNASRKALDLLYRVSLPAFNMRGIYLRDSGDTSKAFEASVQIDPVFRNEWIVTDEAKPAPADEHKDDCDRDVKDQAPAGTALAANYALNAAKVAFEQKIALVLSSPAAGAWVDCPSHLLLHHNGRAFTVVVHGERLPPGLHYTEILGYDTAFPKDEWPQRGALFRVPVTVLRPENPIESHNALAVASVQLGGNGELSTAPRALYQFTNLPCDSGVVHRRFVTVPEGASYADFTVRAHSFRMGDSRASKETADTPDPSRSFMFHAVYLNPEQAYDAHNLDSFFSLTQDAPTKEMRMDVRPGSTLEVTLTQYWSSLDPCAADVTVDFHGLAVENGEEVVLDASSPFTPVHFRSVLRTTKLAPSATIKTWNQPLKPAHVAPIVPLSQERDLIVRGSRTISSLVLTYNFDLKEDSSRVHVRAPVLNDRLYESVYESQLTQIFEANSKRFMFATDAFEEGKALSKGSYTAKIQVRHDDVKLLEKLKDMPVVVEFDLAKELTLPVYSSYAQAVTSSGKFPANKSLKAGKASLVYLGLPDAKSFPSGTKPGDFGTGTLVLAKASGSSTEKGGAIKLRVYAPPMAAPAEKKDIGAAKSAEAKPADAKKPVEATSKKPAEPEQDPAFPKQEQKSPLEASPPAPSPAPSADGSTALTKAPASSSPALSPSSPSSLAVELRDLTIAHLSKLKSDSSANASKSEALQVILPPLLAQFPSHLPLLFLDLRLRHELASTDADRAEVEAKADALLTQHIDQTSLLAHFGRVLDKEDKAAVELRKEKEEVKKIVVKVLTIKLELAMTKLKTFKSHLCRVEYSSAARKELDESPNAQEASKEATSYEQALARYQAIWSELGGWIDLASKDGKTFGAYQLFQHKLARQYGALLKLLNGDIASSETGSAQQQKLLRERVDLLAYLDSGSSHLYAHLLRHEQEALIVRFPKDFQPF